MRRIAAVIFACAAFLLLRPEAIFYVVERLPVADGLPDESELPPLLAACQITAASGAETVLCPQALPAEAFPDHLHAALVAGEDRRFLYHTGVDPLAVARALAGIAGLKEETGGSTITQQLARTLFLERANPQRRKLREWVLARRIERVASKAEILTMYLNVAPLAHGLFGFDAAARYYFNKPARAPSVMESAFLVAQLPAPNARDPFDDPHAAFEATRARLDLMLDAGMITASQAADARAEARAALREGGLARVDDAARRTARHPYEYRRVRDLARRQLGEAGISAADAERLFVTLDPRFQQWADGIAARAPDGYAAAALFMSKSGRVLAISGPPYESAQFNAAFQAVRSLGSLGKVILHALAQERPDLRRALYSTGPMQGYSPREPSRNCRRPLRLPEALAYSCNRPFARLARRLPKEATELTKRLGFVAPDNPVLTGLGGVHGNLLSATRMFAAIGNGGRLVAPRALIGVVGREGRLLMGTRPGEGTRILSAEAARAVAIDLRGPVASKGGTGRLAAGRARAAHVSGKTGTSDDNRDAWFVGFTRDYVGGVWAYATAAKPAPVSGGGYPAREFGRVVDAYWIPKNAEAVRPDPVGESDLPDELDPARAVSVNAARDLACLLLMALLPLATLRIAGPGRRHRETAPPAAPDARPSAPAPIRAGGTQSSPSGAKHEPATGADRTRDRDTDAATWPPGPWS